MVDKQQEARLEALFEVHQAIAEDIGENRILADGDMGDHAVGEKEALNRVEELIADMALDYDD